MTHDPCLRRRGQLPVATLLAGAAILVMAGCASGNKTAAPSSVVDIKLVRPDTTPPKPVDPMPAGFRPSFAAADARARLIVFNQQCESTILRLRSAARFGAVATAPRRVHCERTADGVPIGGVFDIDTAFTRARRVMMVRLDSTRPRYMSAVDTVRIARLARLERDVDRLIGPAWRRLNRPYSVVPMLKDDGSMEAWVMPLSARGGLTAVIGGDMGFDRGADGKPVKVVDHTPTWKLITIPATGAVTLASAEAEVAAVSDLVVARSLGEQGRAVTVTTTIAKSELKQERDPATGSPFSWVHARATP
jgi:hypothetical protein